ncbi:dTDP-4-dehydrorhamnose 3,5-epimerase [Thermoflexibacter ruber]|uniref:dTDP-4-dehydrorhamnose 3,5-epimerase n=1 Tax=Thermoflexibacter ruber TaxID=1003 RepID=A0A1I2GLL5_9BACT|nr:dTDP-4-dehydrorhamnose 3,5-epimerase [Thermoflexibacter ruber]SFF18138.1 dTDP-4-dehydrorhamnose 3,5-epimerase [Thermoflexibacter ruber]
MLFEFEHTLLSNLWLITPKPFQDERGLFFRFFCKKEFEKIGFSKEFAQLNHSINKLKGTIRGMHYQEPPFAETKLVRCIKGKILDVVVDIRQNSPTFLQHYAVELSAENKRMLLIPEGFAHGFQTLEDDTEILYHHTNFYTPSAERGLRYNDLMLNISWIMLPTAISERDANFPLLSKDFKGIFIEN